MTDDYDYPEHCKECGAYCANKADQDLHKEWHAALVQTMTIVAHTAEAAASYMRPLA